MPGYTEVLSLDNLLKIKGKNIVYNNNSYRIGGEIANLVKQMIPDFNGNKEQENK